MRIVAISDQHGVLPPVPPCDLLIIAGDICQDFVDGVPAIFEPEGQKEWFDTRVRAWLRSAPATYRIATWGNHDFCGQQCDFSADSPSRAPLTELQILVDEMTLVPASCSIGASRDVAVWAAPWSNRFMDWAFMQSPGELERVYARIPPGVDILISHQPPFGYGDLMYTPQTGRLEHIGSRELLHAINRVRPKLVICGHVHESRGCYEHEGIPIYNVSVVDEQYRHVHPVTEIDFQV